MVVMALSAQEAGKLTPLDTARIINMLSPALAVCLGCLTPIFFASLSFTQTVPFQSAAILQIVVGAIVQLVVVKVRGRSELNLPPGSVTHNRIVNSFSLASVALLLIVAFGLTASPFSLYYLALIFGLVIAALTFTRAIFSRPD